MASVSSSSDKRQTPESWICFADGDGTAERGWKRGARQPVAAMFVHAGAGYHSTANERVHLEACSEAARKGMKLLKAGGTAPEAVEAAIKCLEDKEITNAGFGSNLNIDGVVECDATVVDHLGRSGACGAVPGIKNPISLAKIILDSTSRPLTLRRVPPNILVGQGALEFAMEHGMVPTTNDNLVSKNAKDRYHRWNEDLRKAEAQADESTAVQGKRSTDTKKSPTISDYEKAADPASVIPRRDHASAILTGTWNEGQPDSPYRTGSPVGESGSDPISPSSSRPSVSPLRSTTSLKRMALGNPLAFMGSAFQPRSQPPAKRSRVRKSFSDDMSAASSHDSWVSTDEGVDRGVELDNVHAWRRMAADSVRDAQDDSTASVRDDQKRHEDMDLITDTVGAIAIDLKGNIAAGSSSGGIGMKHRGRIGPAALVGIGTAVVPEDPEDEQAASIAAVTSGTGEHMATSVASARCAERLFHGTRRGPGGRNVDEEDEHAIMESFILDDFMNHPGVRNQPSAGAIGVMAVRKDRSGIYFYFAHNTDSFALASMSSREREPVCVMSRLGEKHHVAQGGRKIRLN